MTQWVKTVLVAVVFTLGCSAQAPERPDRPEREPVEVGPSAQGKADGFDWGSGCEGGNGTFSQAIARDAVVTVGTIPEGMTNVVINLTADEDVDIQLIDADGTKVVHWPDGLLNGAAEQSTTYNGLTITWSGYNGDGTHLGHEFIRLEGVTGTELTMKAYGYAAGQAQVDYAWDATEDCQDSGSGSFTQQIEKDAVVLVGTIPAGLQDVKIQLRSPVDIDIQLSDRDGTKVIHWPEGILDGPDRQSGEYKGTTFVWSGYNGDGTGKGNEYIEVEGTTPCELVMKVFGYEAGEATVTYSWGSSPDITADVIFSPTYSSNSHVARAVELIDGAQRSVDIAMYSLSDSRVNKALERALQRGVKVRFVYHGAQEDRWDPDGSKSAKLEELGVDVRFATKSKVMHHKFMIVDGPRKDASGQVDLDAAKTAWLVTGSGNWSYGAQTKYDENTLFLTGAEELVLRYQHEFNRLWNYAYDFTWKTFPYEAAAGLDPSSFPDNPDTHALFTSANFKMNQSFTVISGSYKVARAIADELAKAQKSIYVASGHFRSWPIFDALRQLKASDPQLDIRVYLDGQEYISKWYADKEEQELQSCLAAAGGDPDDELDCRLSGNYFSYKTHVEGIPLRFKYYAYRWDYHYAEQMHHKYIIIDGKKLLTGSYNLSDNAERGTLENVAVLSGATFQPLVKKYTDNFLKLWNTDQDGSLFTALKQEITAASTIPLVFEPMALTWTQVTELKQLIRDNCSLIDSEDYRKHPEDHKTCPRNP